LICLAARRSVGIAVDSVQSSTALTGKADRITGASSYRLPQTRDGPLKMKTSPWLALFLLGLMSALHASQAASVEVLDTVKLANNVYALIGPTTNRDAENLGNNANFGIVVTDAGVVLIDPGASYQGAKMIHEAIRSVTDQPVKLVINTGGQDHRWLGNGYFKSLGAHIIANQAAVADQRARLQDQLIRLGGLAGDEALEGTEPTYADETFTDQKIFEFGGIRLELHHAGHAHTPGDSFVWIPKHSILFSGDIVYVDRMLGIGPQSAHLSWIGAFEAIAAKEPKTIVAGHGRPTDLAKATQDSYDYLVFLRAAVRSLIDADRGIEDVGKIDQSRFSYLSNYDLLKGRNAQRVYEELEWE
jgi:glyoxylase-like metal-dependent hydrolase (beta-lactamase superfamily II)